jgi:hypothetical protein
VRTGNRKTLIDNEFKNSRFVVRRGRVESSAECGRIVFSLMRELQNNFVDKLRQFTDCFLPPTKEFNSPSLLHLRGLG